MVTIPRNIVEKEGLIENQIIKIEIEKIRKSGFGLHKGLVPFTKEDAFKGQLEK